MSDVWLIRHAQTEWSQAGKHTGRIDLPLAPGAGETAAALKPRLDGTDFKLVLCSPLERAKQTASAVGLLGRAQFRDDLMEWDYGDYEGITSAEIREQRPDWWLWRDGAPGGESPQDVEVRVDRVVDEVAEVDGDIVIVAHGHLLQALAARWLGQPVEFGGRLTLGTASLSVLANSHGRRAISRWNT